MKYARYTERIWDGPNHPITKIVYDIPLDKADLDIPHEVVEY